MSGTTTSPIRRPHGDRKTPFRLVPHLGRPRCVVEHAAQHVWHHKLAWYIAAVATASFALQVGTRVVHGHWWFS